MRKRDAKQGKNVGNSYEKINELYVHAHPIMFCFVLCLLMVGCC